jgi:hypothetical protein
MVSRHHDTQNVVRLKQGKPSSKVGRDDTSQRPDGHRGHAAAELSRPESIRAFRSLPCSILLLLLLSFLFFATGARAQVTLAWTASTSPNVAGYTIYYGTASGNYAYSLNVGNVLTYTLTGLSAGATYYFTTTAYDSAGDQSGDSNVVSYTVPTACTYSISPTSASFTASGGTGSVGVTTQSGCAWTATSGANWITFTPASGNGSGTVSYSAAANTGTSSRTAASTVAGLSFAVTEAASTKPPAATYTITASAGTGGSISPSGSVTVNSGANESFSITPNSGYAISNVMVDGVSQAKPSSYTFNNVATNHTITVTFSSTSRHHRW